MAKRVRYTLYDRLDVSPYANQEEIQAAFRRAAKLIHPDKGVDDGAAETARREAWMKELNEAADILRDPAARAEYDAEIGLRRPGRLRRASRASGPACVAIARPGNCEPFPAKPPTWDSFPGQQTPCATCSGRPGSASGSVFLPSWASRTCLAPSPGRPAPSSNWVSWS